MYNHKRPKPSVFDSAFVYEYKYYKFIEIAWLTNCVVAKRARYPNLCRNGFEEIVKCKINVFNRFVCDRNFSDVR